jgi:hypothetical protein
MTPASKNTTPTIVTTWSQVTYDVGGDNDRLLAMSQQRRKTNTAKARASHRLEL